VAYCTCAMKWLCIERVCRSTNVLGLIYAVAACCHHHWLQIERIISDNLKSLICRCFHRDEIIDNRRALRSCQDKATGLDLNLLKSTPVSTIIKYRLQILISNNLSRSDGDLYDRVRLVRRQNERQAAKPNNTCHTWIKNLTFASLGKLLIGSAAT
jgi:hypothetical protein